MAIFSSLFKKKENKTDISWGRIEEISVLFSFFLNNELKIAILFYFNWFLRFAGVECFVEKLDNFFCAEASHAYAGAYKSLFNYRQTLFKLASIFVETCFRGGGLFFLGTKPQRF